MLTSRNAETVYCHTCQRNVVAIVERYLKGTTMAICPWCSAIIHPPTAKIKP